MGRGRLRGIAVFLLVCLVVSAVAAVGGVLFEVVRGRTTIAHSVAYAMWIAAAIALLLMVPAGSGFVWRSSRFRPIEGWWLLAAAMVLAAVGALVDAVGGP